LRVVFDASTVVGATLKADGIPRQALLAARERPTILLSNAVYAEIGEVLARPKFARVLTEERRPEILELLAAAAIWIDPSERIEDCRDDKDNKYLELASAGGAEVIVTSDDDLLVLDPWRSTRILRARDFLAIA
jgi:hypothetical protein